MILSFLSLAAVTAAVPLHISYSETIRVTTPSTPSLSLPPLPPLPPISDSLADLRHHAVDQSAELERIANEDLAEFIRLALEGRKETPNQPITGPFLLPPSKVLQIPRPLTTEYLMSLGQEETVDTMEENLEAVMGEEEWEVVVGGPSQKQECHCHCSGPFAFIRSWLWNLSPWWRFAIWIFCIAVFIAAEEATLKKMALTR